MNRLVKKYQQVALASLFVLSSFSSATLAGELECKAHYSTREMNISDLTGSPWFKTIKVIARQMDADAQTPFSIASWDQVLEKKSLFHPEAYAKILKLFLDRDEGRILSKDPEFKTDHAQILKAKAEAALKVLVDALSGTKVTTIDLAETKRKDAPPAILTAILRKVRELKPFPPSSAVISSMNLATFLSIVSGAGSKVNLNNHNYFVNVGYELDGMTENEKSGRSSSHSPNYGFNDASDTYLLRALDKLIKNMDPSKSQFFDRMFDLLLRSDAGRYEELNGEEQASLTDFIAVYSAEFRRSLMSDLRTHRWMDDLAEVYMVSAYGSAAGKVIDQKGFSDGEATTYFAVGANGSGIGVMRGYRHHLQELVTGAVRTLQPQLVENIEKLMGKKPGQVKDLIHDFMLFINDPRNQNKVLANSQELSASMKEFIHFIGTQHAQISSYVSANVDMRVIAKLNKILEEKRKRAEEKKKQKH